jgi:hypothetical protein
MKSHIGRQRIFKDPNTNKKIPVSIVRDEIYFPEEGEYNTGWGKYEFGVWLEEQVDDPGYFTISFPYWRNGKFAGQTTLRAEPGIIKFLFEGLKKRGWLDKKGWSVNG